MDGLSSSTHIPAGRFYWKSNLVGDFLKTLFCAHLAPGRGGAAIIQAYFPTPPSIYCGAVRDIAIFVAAPPRGGQPLTARDRAIYPDLPRRGTMRPEHSYHSLHPVTPPSRNVPYMPPIVALPAIKKDSDVHYAYQTARD